MFLRRKITHELRIFATRGVHSFGNKISKPSMKPTLLLTENTAPTPISEFNFSEKILSIMKDKNIESLYPLQASCYNPIIEGKDLIGRAKTGTGKTLAFALPLIEKLQKTPSCNRPRALILAPTRELAKQVAKEFDLFGGKLQTAVVYGGASYQDQSKYEILIL